MNVNLSPELDERVKEKVRSGMYNTASEVIREALRQMLAREKGLGWLREEARLGFDALDNGEYQDLNREAFFKAARGKRGKKAKKKR